MSGLVRLIPLAAASPSLMPSWFVSGFKGSEPNRYSAALVRPSWSGSCIIHPLLARVRLLTSTGLVWGRPDPSPSWPELFAPQVHTRSEEHTSELQSHLNLVCRL